MPQPDDSREEALRSLNARARALEAKTAQPVSHEGAAAKVTGYGYRLIGVLVGGVLVGLGLGAAVDALVGTGPWGMIVGVLVGFAVSIWMAVRSAQQMSTEVSKAYGPARDLPDDDEED
jgi:ATP synthase protein I